MCRKCRKCLRVWEKKPQNPSSHTRKSPLTAETPGGVFLPPTVRSPQPSGGYFVRSGQKKRQSDLTIRTGLPILLLWSRKELWRLSFRGSRLSLEETHLG